MGTFGPPDSACDRARTWASVELDGELSELERALLVSHVDRCDECAAVVADMRALTAELRAAPLETPPKPLFVPGSARRARRRAAFPVRVAVAATLVALAAALGALTGSLADEPPPGGRAAPEFALLPASASESRDLHSQRRLQVVDLDQQRAFPPGRQGGNV